ncbi:ABC transporter permease [Neptunomonas sp.]|uniref:ABC transporter permease n=1 Tax=Neptunomonas sp. TaxID=1971898 RepID=UPI00356A05D2
MSTFEHKPRTSLQVTFSVLKALFIRDALQRTMAERFSWFWILVEPISHIIVFVGIRGIMGGSGLIAGAEFIPWLVVGLMTFFVFREGFLKSIGAINSNKALYSYRQVKPVDTVIARALVEGLLKSLIFVLLIIGFELLGANLLPADPLSVIFLWLLAWMLGLAAGLFFSVANALVLEVGIVVNVMTLPLYFLSGVMIPLNFLPHNLLQYLMYNPLVHLIELMRLAFFENYRPINNLDLMYVMWWVLITMALGLAMHLRFEYRVKAA